LTWQVPGKPSPGPTKWSQSWGLQVIRLTTLNWQQSTVLDQPYASADLGIKVASDFRSLDSDLDTLLVGGGRATWELPKNEEFLGWLRQTSGKLHRLAACGIRRPGPSGGALPAPGGVYPDRRADRL